MRKEKFNMVVVYPNKPSEKIEVYGFVFTYLGFDFVVHRPYHFLKRELMKEGYEVSEKSTGANVIRYCHTRRDAIERAKQLLDKVGVEKIKTAISRFLT